MTGTKILIGQIAVVFALIIGAVWLATQMTAEALGFQPALGAPWSFWERTACSWGAGAGGICAMPDPNM